MIAIQKSFQTQRTPCFSLLVLTLCIIQNGIRPGESGVTKPRYHGHNHEEGIFNKLHHLPNLQDSANYSEKGIVVNLTSSNDDGVQHEDLQIYVSGLLPNGDVRGRVVIWNYDVFGFVKGITRQVVDYLAENGNFTVILPDLYRGGSFPEDKAEQAAFIKKNHVDDEILADWATVKEWAVSNGANSFATTGTCSGTYIALILTKTGDFSATAFYHPSHSYMSKVIGGEVTHKNLLNGVMDSLLKKDEAKNIHFLSFVTKSDGPEYRKGGLDYQILGQDRLTIFDMHDMNHGYVSQGDLTDQSVREGIKYTMRETIDAFNKYL